RIEFDDRMYSRVVSALNGEVVQIGRFMPSEYLVVDGKEVTDFTLENDESADVSDVVGAGKRYTLTGVNEGVRKNVEVILYDDFPTMAVYEVTYVNEGDADLSVDSWVNNRYAIRAQKGDGDAFWSYQSGSYSRRPDWVLPVNAGFNQ